MKSKELIAEIEKHIELVGKLNSKIIAGKTTFALLNLTRDAYLRMEKAKNEEFLEMLDEVLEKIRLESNRDDKVGAKILFADLGGISKSKVNDLLKELKSKIQSPQTKPTNSDVAESNSRVIPSTEEQQTETKSSPLVKDKTADNNNRKKEVKKT